MKPSPIAWTDYSGGACNFIRGCTPISEGCAHCYARNIYARFNLDFTPTFDQARLETLARQSPPMHSPKRGAGYAPMVFVCDTGDFFHESIPINSLWTALDVLAACPNVTWQILTKRARRMCDVVQGWLVQRGASELPCHIWLGVTAENQARANERVTPLLATPAAVRFVSVEPMLEAINLSDYLRGGLLGWVIAGAESGSQRRHFSRAWAEALYDQCRDAGVPFFAKQDSALRPGRSLLIRGEVRQEWPLTPSL